jgi:hypothetical protein
VSEPTASGRDAAGAGSPTSRRGALRAALAGAVALAAGRAGAAHAQDRDPDLLRDLIAREQAAALAYRSARGRRFEQLAAQEADHAAALASELAALGLTASAPPREPASLTGAAAALATAQGPTAALAAALALEEELLAAYASAVPAIAEPNTRRTAATAMASHGQHRAVLRRRST